MRRKKKITWMLLMVLSISMVSVPVLPVKASAWYTLNSATNDASRYQSDMPNIAIDLPSFAYLQTNYGLTNAVEAIEVNGKRMPFNVEIYLDTGLQVYGKPLDIIANKMDYNKNVKNFATDEADQKIPT